MTESLIKLMIFTLSTSLVSIANATSNEDNAETIYNWAEKKYNVFFSPEHITTQSVDINGDHWHYRYYSGTDTYLGNKDKELYVLGDAFGGLLYIADIDAFYDQIFNNLVDLTGVILEQRSPNCVDYIQKYQSSVIDIQRDTPFQGSLTITLSGDKCIFTSNAIPNHDFNDATAHFATDVSEQDQHYEVTTTPTQNNFNTESSLLFDDAIFLNGVKLDLLAAGCFGVADGNIGCHDLDQPWRYDPMFGEGGFGTDRHHAHTQPEGTYHYHGSPVALFEANKVSPVIGFAADGFPVFGSYFEDNGNIRKASSSYQLKTGNRIAINNINPGGSYDGTFRDDYEYMAGSGDLDECNGMIINGVYGYYVTESFPWVLACFKGTPDTSFASKGLGSTAENPMREGPVGTGSMENIPMGGPPMGNDPMAGGRPR